MNRIHPLTVAKAFYFLFYGAWACLLPFLVLYYRSLGFSGPQIGILASISPLASLLAAPLWSAAADASRRHHRVLLITIAGAALSVLGLSQSRSFWLMVLTVIGFAVFNAPIISLIDATVLHLLGDNRDRYGKIRLWGAVGWGIAGPLAGALVERVGLGASFALYIGMSVLTFFVGIRLPVQPPARSAPFWKGLGGLVTNRAWLMFLLICFTSGAGLSVINNYLFLYLDELRATSTQMGLALTMATISETTVLFFSGAMLARLGPRGLLLLSLAAYVLRAFGYSISVEPWQVLLFQLFHGLTFSTLWVAGVRFAADMAPPGLEATAQGLFFATVMGFGGITGALAGGAVIDTLGGAGLYRASATVVLAALALFLMFGRKREAVSSIRE